MKTIKKWEDFAVRMMRTCFDFLSEEEKEELIRRIRDFIDFYEGEKIEGWEDGDYDCWMPTDQARDVFSDLFEVKNDELVQTEKGKAVFCSLRAGIDVATENYGAGVIGFTKGDLLEMYDGNLPEWVKQSVVNHEFETLKDEAKLIL